MKERFDQTYGNQISKLYSSFIDCKEGGIKLTEDLYEFEIAYLVKEEMASSGRYTFSKNKIRHRFPKR